MRKNVDSIGNLGHFSHKHSKQLQKEEKAFVAVMLGNEFK